jgi:hypothetical protein
MKFGFLKLKHLKKLELYIYDLFVLLSTECYQKLVDISDRMAVPTPRIKRAKYLKYMLISLRLLSDPGSYPPNVLQPN